MMDTSATKKIPVGHAKEYTVWSMDNITNDDLASLTHALGGQSYDWGFQLIPSINSFTSPTPSITLPSTSLVESNSGS